MTPQVTPAPGQLAPSLEQQIDAAAAKASGIVAQFSPQAAAVIAAGTEVEPIISGIVQMFIGLFRHHVKKAASSPAPEPAQSSPGQPGQ